MLTTLKKIYSSTLNERYAEYNSNHDIKINADAAYEQMSEYALIHADIQKIYELEYKLFRLAMEKKKAGGWLPDQAQMRALKWRTNLTKLLNDSIKNLAGVLESWAKQEELLFIIPETYPGGDWKFIQDVKRRADEEKPQMAPVQVGDPIFDQIAEEVMDEYFEKVWTTKEPYKTVEKTLKALQQGVPKDIGSGIVMFHKGLTTAHNNGTMLQYAIKHSPNATSLAPSGNQQFLDDLSNGKLIPKWDKDLQRRNLVSEGLVTEADLPKRHPSPEEIITAIDSLD